MLTPCDDCAADLSALLDGEIDREALLPTLDHLARCASCRGFYLQARALEGPLEALREANAADATHPAAPHPPAPPHLWRRIRARAWSPWWLPRLPLRLGAPGAARRRRPLSLQLSAAAAVLALSLGALWMLAGREGGGAGRDGDGTALQESMREVRLGQGSRAMTDERFLDLTVEILEADRRYRDALGQLLADVQRYGAGPEGSPEGVGPVSEAAADPRV